MASNVAASNVVTSHVEQVIQQARAFFRSKDYQAALECFNFAISKENCYPLSALDNRAATHTKLGNLQSALRDGRRMIREDKANCLGYLRTGKTLQLLGKTELALGIYRYGRSNVSSKDPNFTCLKFTLRELVWKYKPFDITALPLELVEMIMLYLNFRTVSTLQRVSRSWRTLLGSMPRLWRHMDFAAPVLPVPMATIHKCVKRSQGTVNRASLVVARPEHDKHLRYIVARCKSLERLDLAKGFVGATILHVAPYATGLKTLIVARDCTISLDTITQLLGHLSNLNRAEFHNTSFQGFFHHWEGDLSKIRSLVINHLNDAVYGNESWEFGLNLGELIQKIPEARSLTFENWGWRNGLGPAEMDFMILTKLQNLRLAHNGMPSIPCLPSSLQCLDFDNNLNYDRRDATYMMTSYFPELRRLSIKGDHYLDSRRLLALLGPSKGKLEALKIENWSQLIEADIQAHIQAGFLDQVTELSLAYCHVEDPTADLLASTCHHLKSVDLSYSKITGCGLKALVLKPRGKLEHVKLLNCGSVSIDAVEFARSRGIQVSYYFPRYTQDERNVRENQ